jgi:hypothetical protein
MNKEQIQGYASAIEFNKTLDDNQVNQAIETAKKWATGANEAQDVVMSARLEQFKKWGVQKHDLPTWMTILLEEAGDLAQEILHIQFDGDESRARLEHEAAHVAAVGLAIVQLARTGKA